MVEYTVSSLLTRLHEIIIILKINLNSSLTINHNSSIIYYYILNIILKYNVNYYTEIWCLVKNNDISSKSAQILFVTYTVNYNIIIIIFTPAA